MSVRVAAVPYIVRIVRALLSSDLNGETHIGDCVIHIREDMPPAKQEQTFWHELLHVMLDGEPHGANTPKNEEYVTRLSNTLYGVLIDNDLLADGWFDKIIDDRGGRK